MRVKRLALVLTAAAAVTPGVALASKPRTVAPSGAQRKAILTAFRQPRKAWPCMSVRLAASNRGYARVRPLTSKRCVKWAFNGDNVLQRRRGNRWKVLFEGSAFACPLSRIPRQVQRDLGVCP